MPTAREKAESFRAGSCPDTWGLWGGSAAPYLRVLQLGLQVLHVHVLVAVFVGLAQADAVDDGGMVQLIGQHRVLRGEQSLSVPNVQGQPLLQGTTSPPPGAEDKAAFDCSCHVSPVKFSTFLPSSLIPWLSEG